MNKIIGVIAGIIAIVGSAFGVLHYLDARYLKTENHGSYKYLPSGAVIAFTGNCPEDKGWSSYPNGEGRFLLGAGKSRDIDQTYEVGDDGGSSFVQLTEAQMPSHRHDDVDGEGVANHLLVQVDGRPLTETEVDGISSHREFNQRDGVRMAERGKDEAHENRPPYIVVNFCHFIGSP
ncbi:MAG: hypothetical protein OXC91_06865 [Rhodobacteraceae bacterium]|nr:hypothetical protein [Paracoccaceae bacterium]